LDTLAKTLEQAERGIESLIVTSTCNRTEIYGFAEHPFQLIKLICENKGSVERISKVGLYIKIRRP
jgi:glutamyl-tRNA reductase